MARIARPWFSAEKGWWMVHLGGKKVRLAKGKANKKQADRKFREIQFLRDTNPAPESGGHTVASVVDIYLTHARRHCCERAYGERRRYLQLFAEEHGWRPVSDRDCLPFHLESWIDAHAEWRGDWTRAMAAAVVQRAFNYAARNRLIATNPFRGFTLRPGEPRRPLTDAEFQALLRATSSWARRRRFRPTADKKKLYPSDLRRRKRPSAGARFRELLVFLRFTGARPGEAAGLQWEHIDFEAGGDRGEPQRTALPAGARAAG